MVVPKVTMPFNTKSWVNDLDDLGYLEHPHFRQYMFTTWIPLCLADFPMEDLFWMIWGASK